ncbi:peptide chain release factor N(5)-glutamine methyltransferase [Rickettsiales endosymbiont of Stachyamoeba lipophora]|uniref:peptide chain release factor N(5)-glutamine methyltransferase n=1 Tax=Rickettsiales endosymbiont of Stachyamoeba lipophora TaxID=2486578 RepID=UPI000F64C1BF|nr:peptide chain release factor N(5)-glutamine methyltransferase [Rickettsiales endosymbiont of Stachyamoeba lipophora]AZL15259.1 peptide chain release factor N(5)-glutamine methyltransferase [Rickettsiales endosymbiont of Stachyamoeba lipophora]
MKQSNYPKQYDIDYLLKFTTNLLKNAAIASPNLDARLLLMEVSSFSIEELIKNHKTSLSELQANKLADLIEQRLNGKPISKITGKKFFWQDEFIVNEHVLDPRPDTECLIENVCKLLKNKTNESLSILDLGVGSGCILLSLLHEFPHATGVGIDLSEQALNVAKLNAKNLKLEDRAKFKINNWLENITEKFDLVVSNPPYIKSDVIADLQKEVKEFDPMLALDGGENGLDCYCLIANNLNYITNLGAYFVCEIGINQEQDVITIIEQNSDFKHENSYSDLNDVTRVIAFSKTKGIV